MWAELALGVATSCALLESQSVMCWGANLYGEAGGATVQNDLPPTRVEDVRAATQLAVGFGHACALIDDGIVQCWGANRCGQRGDGDSSDRSVAHTVDGVSTAISVVAGDNHTCALLSDGTVSCWGRYVESCSSFDIPELPRKIPGISDAVELAAGRFHTCARLRDGSLSCWGRNWAGETADGSYVYRGDEPATVLGLSGPVRHVAGGGEFTCAVLMNGDLSCWGDNVFGQLGWGGRWLQDLPVEVQGLPALAPPGN